MNIKDAAGILHPFNTMYNEEINDLRLFAIALADQAHALGYDVKAQEKPTCDEAGISWIIEVDGDDGIYATRFEYDSKEFYMTLRGAVSSPLRENTVQRFLDEVKNYGRVSSCQDEAIHAAELFIKDGES